MGISLNVVALLFSMFVVGRLDYFAGFVVPISFLIAFFVLRSIAVTDAVAQAANRGLEVALPRRAQPPGQRVVRPLALRDHRIGRRGTGAGLRPPPAVEEPVGIDPPALLVRA